MVAGKKQVNKEILEYEPASNVSEFRSANKNILLRQGDAKDLSFIEDATVDYIFTDPPYGESVPYLGLSLLWGSWLGLDKEFRFESEILISEKEREGMPKTIDQYKTDLQSAFLEMYRVLKPNGWMSVTFHNRDISVWNALVNAAREAHFEYVNDMYLLPRIQSAKSGLAKGGSMTGDIVINFRRPEGIPPRFVSKNIDAEQMMVEEAKQIIVERGGVATLDQLMRGICSVLMKHGVVHKFNDAASIKNVLGIYLKDLGNNKWTLMQAEPETILQTIPLELRIETIIKSCLNDGPKTIDEILVPVFTILNNGRTPEREDVYHVLTSLAEEEKGIWRLKTADQLEFAFVREREGDFRGYGDEESDHNRTILWLAKLGNRAGYRVYVGKNERSKNKDLSEISVSHLDIPYVDETEIKANDIDQIDVIWLSEKNMPAAIFEVENTTRAMTCIRRMDNLLKMSPEVRVYSTIVAPTKMESVVQKRMKSKSSEMVMDDKSLWGYVLYPDLATLYQIVCESTVEVPFVLDSILRIRKMPF